MKRREVLHFVTGKYGNGKWNSTGEESHKKVKTHIKKSKKNQQFRVRTFYCIHGVGERKRRGGKKFNESTLESDKSPQRLE